ncbi:hypothetical protein RHSIM_Rhsim13G0007100 [Rhododendron simsii]|uniref:Uncharacterized protein n=1 Tax=Rhododendron simsii TaxID=118357 RepID=A0A834G138_RHOSS|nr:hypothetical protein RHSIM_Rhsim13G0007100 [Rhododendron simsii]
MFLGAKVVKLISFIGKRWTDLCFPVEEDGISIWRLADVLQAFSYRSWWSFTLVDLSGLISCMLYIVNSLILVFLLSPLLPLMSNVWRSMAAVRDDTDSQIFWFLSYGSSSFCWDSWLPSSPLLPSEFCSKICEVDLSDGFGGSPVWKLTTHGIFSTCSAWDRVRYKHCRLTFSYSSSVKSVERGCQASMAKRLDFLVSNYRIYCLLRDLKARNRSRFEGQPMDTSSIISSSIFMIKDTHMTANISSSV